MDSIYEIRKKAIISTSRNEKALVQKDRERALHDLARAICICPDLAERTKEYISLIETCKENDIQVPQQHDRVVHTNGTVYENGRPVQKLGIPVVSYSYNDTSVTFRPESVSVEFHTQGMRKNCHSATIPYLAAEEDDIFFPESAEVISRMACDILDAVSQFRTTEQGFYTWLDSRTGVRTEEEEEEAER